VDARRAGGAEAVTPLLEVRRLSKVYAASGLSIRRRAGGVRAVDDVSFSIPQGSIVGLVGESGSGKSTVGEILVRLEGSTGGEVLFDGKDIAHLHGAALHAFRRQAQMIFQDPYQTLNPRFRVRQWVEEPLLIHGMGKAGERLGRVKSALAEAELRPPEAFLDRYPHHLSGGQRQRVAIARALVTHPRFIVADEPVSMLDVSIRSGILRLLRRLRDEHGLTILYISHDLSTVRYLCNQVVIMYAGKVMETGATDGIIGQPTHPYTRALIAAVPRGAPASIMDRDTVEGEPPDPIAPPPGCRFAPRCPLAQERCRTEEPLLRPTRGSQTAACHYPVVES
jgi:peptide/nickel transport system ATP-binding protein